MPLNQSKQQLTLSQVVADAENNAKTMLRILRAHYQSVTDDGIDEEAFVLSTAQVLAQARQLRADLEAAKAWERANDLYNSKCDSK